MGPDAANLVSSIAKSLEVDRSPGANQRASAIGQKQLAEESIAAMSRKKTAAADQLRQARIRHERERKRRESEKRMKQNHSNVKSDETGSVIDVVV